jgi:glycerol-3-phosphate dehydrogenase
MAGARSKADMGEHFGPITEREVDYLVREEWAQTADDILWRRTKLGLRTSAEGRGRLEQHLASTSAIETSATSFGFA